MKKLTALLLIFVMVFSFTSCGNKKNPEPEVKEPDVTTESAIEEKTTEPAIEDGPVKLNSDEDWQKIKAFFQQTEHTLFNCYRFEDPEKNPVAYDGGCIGKLHLSDGSDVKPFTNQRVDENGLVFELCMTEGGDKRDSYIVVHTTDIVGEVYVAFGGTQLVYNQETKKKEAVEFAQNEFIYEDIESYINLCAYKDNFRVISCDIDDDSLYESLALGDDIGIYDYVNDMVVSLWVMQSVPGSSFCDLCMNDSTVKEGYINCISVQAADERASGIYSYTDGIIQKIASLDEAVNDTKSHILSEDDLPEIQSLMADANDKLSKLCFGMIDEFAPESSIPAPSESGLDYYYELPDNELFNNREELLSYLSATFTKSFSEKILSMAKGIVEWNGKLYYTGLGVGGRLDVDDLKHERFIQMESNGEVYFTEIMSFNLLDMDKWEDIVAGKTDGIIDRVQFEYVIKYEDGWKYDEFFNIYTGIPYDTTITTYDIAK